MLASGFLRIDCWLFGRLDGASSGRQGAFGFVEGGYRMTRHLENKKASASLNGCAWIAHAYQTMGRTTAAGSQRGNEGQRVGCPSETVMNWWTSRRGLDLQMSSAVNLASALPSRFDALPRFQRFPTRSTLYVEIVIRERDQAIMECRTFCRNPTTGSEICG